MGKSGLKRAFLFEWQKKSPAYHVGQAGHVLKPVSHPVALPSTVGSVLPPDSEVTMNRRKCKGQLVILTSLTPCKE
jgi:hypothetical protein